MAPLAHHPPRPRRRVRSPAYPVAALLCACSAAPSTAPASQPPTVVVAATLASPLEPVDAEPTGESLALGAPARFPEDDEVIAVGCGGGCPPAYVLEANARDRMQVEARVRYCEAQGIALLSGKAEIQVTTVIDAAGAVTRVQVESQQDVPEAIRGCSALLIRSATFKNDPPYERTDRTTVRIGPSPLDRE